MQSGQTIKPIGMTVSACIWLSLFPLLQGGTFARITHDKWIIMIILTGMTVICFCIDLVICRRIRIVPEDKKSPVYFTPLILASALFFWTLLSCLFSSFGPETWLLGESARYEGLLTQCCYYILFVCFFFSRVSLKPVLISAAAGVAVFFIVVLLQRSGANPFGPYPAGRSYAQNPEFQGTIGNIDMCTGYLLLLAGLFLYGLVGSVTDLRIRGCRRFVLPVILALALPIVLWLILTMEVQFGVVSLAVLFLFTLLRFLPKKYRLPLLILLIVLILLCVWFWPGRSGGVWELHEILHGRGRLSFGSDRVAVWLYSLRLAQENLLLGGGSGTFESRFNRYISDNSLIIPKEQDGSPLPDYFDNPHNEYVAQLTDHGLPALLLFLALLFFAISRRRDIWLPMLTPYSAAVLCYMVQAFFSFSVCIVAPVFWIVLALSFRDAE